ncbi:MAG: SpoIIE family protein phosphatase [Acidobacteriota bacterium]|jgi:sigma-B regulation protein RsbU (phosphoserine phosphatase)|nr:MAG: chemotaxis protein [Acidobacteriota bacterium]
MPDAPPPQSMHAPPSTILVVDDSAVNLQVLVRTLSGNGHRILAARDGATALAIARRAKPDLVLLDVMMPELDGFEVCRMLKAAPDTSDTAVIFLSARGDVSDKVSGLELGAVDYITKPIQAEEVLARVAGQLTRRALERELRWHRDRLERELEGAAAMQRLLLPAALPSPALAGFAAYYRTSRHAGGDYYDVLDLGGDRYGVLVADVSGHGAPAAIVMAMIHAVVHGYRGAPDDPPAMLRYLNEHFVYLRDTPMFATALYGVIDVPRRTLRLSCAGHPPPLHLASDSRPGELGIDAVMPLFWDAFDAVPCTEHHLEPGDRLLFYTDGVTDREGPEGARYETEQLVSLLQRIGHCTPTAMIDHIVADLDAFAAGCEPGDDQTLVVVGLE